MRVTAKIGERFPTMTLTPDDDELAIEVPDKLVRDLTNAQKKLLAVELEIAKAVGWDQSYWTWRDAEIRTDGNKTPVVAAVSEAS